MHYDPISFPIKQMVGIDCGEEIKKLKTSIFDDTIQM